MPPAGIRRRVERGRKVVQVSHSPPRRGGVAAPSKNSSCSEKARTGWSVRRNLQALTSRRTDHYYGFALSRSRLAPVCGASVASQLFITAAATSPLRGGEFTRLHFILTGATA